MLLRGSSLVLVADHLLNDGVAIEVVALQVAVDFCHLISSLLRIQRVAVCLDCRDNLRSTCPEHRVDSRIELQLFAIFHLPGVKRGLQLLFRYRIATLGNILCHEEVVLYNLIPRNICRRQILEQLLLAELLCQALRANVFEHPGSVDVVQPADDFGSRSFLHLDEVRLLQSLLEWNAMQNATCNICQVLTGVGFNLCNSIVSLAGHIPVNHRRNFSFPCCASVFADHLDEIFLAVFVIHITVPFVCVCVYVYIRTPNTLERTTDSTKLKY